MTSPQNRRYLYVGPVEIRDQVRGERLGVPIRSLGELEAWIASRVPSERREPFTFTVDIDGTLRLAPRRSEHVACAGEQPVLAAGEISFSQAGGAWTVCGVNNHSTGYCPDAASWVAVRNSLDCVGVQYPSGYTEVFSFRRCPGCLERNLVKDDDFHCVFCGVGLPLQWNFDSLRA